MALPRVVAVETGGDAVSVATALDWQRAEAAKASPAGVVRGASVEYGPHAAANSSSGTNAANACFTLGIILLRRRWMCGERATQSPSHQPRGDPRSSEITTPYRYASINAQTPTLPKPSITDSES